jgi:hypothetical protein
MVLPGSGAQVWPGPTHPPILRYKIVQFMGHIFISPRSSCKSLIVSLLEVTGTNNDNRPDAAPCAFVPRNVRSCDLIWDCVVLSPLAQKWRHEAIQANLQSKVFQIEQFLFPVEFRLACPRFGWVEHCRQIAALQKHAKGIIAPDVTLSQRP